MKLRFLTSVGGNRGAFMAGQVIEPDQMDDELIRFLNDGICESVREDSTEKAVTAVRERAVTRPNRRGKERRGAWPAVPKLIAGGLAICLGGGPSLAQADVDLVRGRGVVVAINDAYRMAPWADVLYAADGVWWGWHQGVPSFKGLKYTLQTSASKWPSVQVLQNTGETGLDLIPTGLRTGHNSGYQAINLAVHLGATRILLLGYDMQASGGQQHWFGHHPNKSESNYENYRTRFAGIVEPLTACGVQVLNCSRETALDIFPRVALEDALAETPARG